jgi:hypothetical protein
VDLYVDKLQPECRSTSEINTANEFTRKHGKVQILCEPVVTKQNYIQEEVKSRLYVRYACYRAVENIFACLKLQRLKYTTL